MKELGVVEDHGTPYLIVNGRRCIMSHKHMAVIFILISLSNEVTADLKSLQIRKYTMVFSMHHDIFTMLHCEYILMCVPGSNIQLHCIVYNVKNVDLKTYSVEFR